MIKTFIFCLFFSLISAFGLGQNGEIHGIVKNKTEVIEFAKVYIGGTNFFAMTNTAGHFHLRDIPFGYYTLTVSSIGYESIDQDILIDESNSTLDLEVVLTDRSFEIDQVVVSGTKTVKRQTESPVIVNVINSLTLQNVQACNLSEGLKFQPGLRVETNCQTCNYTQLRMNGLTGGYSQILINGRPIFSPLTGLYGLEQIPTNMIDRIEVIRGGGSSLYGSSAIGGTVNVLTKLPKKNSYEIDYNFHSISGRANDSQISGNATLVGQNKNSGLSFFFKNRDREAYDHNQDNFSEIPQIETTSFGANTFFLPNENQKLEINLSAINEYRFGGEISDEVAHLTQQSEERFHKVYMANADYQINFNENNSSLITYLAWQQTSRKHYTGIIPDEPIQLQNHLENPPYGNSLVSTYNAGIQFNQRFKKFLLGENTMTFGAEYIDDDVIDEIEAYAYLIDQRTKLYGAFGQSDWELTENLNWLLGARIDQHNLVDKPIISPRTSLLYQFKKYTQLRLNFGTGYRAPQAFDSDLHIAFAGGGVSRILLSPDLIPERSQSWSTSINFDKPGKKHIAGFTIEGFYTQLQNAFILQPIGEDDFGERFEKRNGQNATVQGGTLELRANFDFKLQMEAGLTIQTSKFDNPVQYIDELEGIREFIRTPNEYGFGTLSYTPNSKWTVNLNYVYTGPMFVPHFAGAPNQDMNEIIETNSFSELSGKIDYSISLKNINSKLKVYIGIKNMFDAYQEEFDVGKNRDSNFVFGPAQPRTYFLGLRFSSL